MKTKTIALLVLSALTMSVRSNATPASTSNPFHDDEVIATMLNHTEKYDFKNHDYLVKCKVQLGSETLNTFAWTGKTGGHIHKRSNSEGDVLTKLDTTGETWTVEVTQNGNTISQLVPKLAEGEKREIRLSKEVCLVVEHEKPNHLWIF